MKRIGILVFLLGVLSISAWAQQPINVANIGGNAVATGNGTTSTGTQRVTISSDSTGQVTLASGATVGLNAGANTIGKVDILGNGGASMDLAQGGATAATNALQTAGVFNTSLPTLTNGQGGAIQLDAKAQQLTDLNYVGGAAIALGNGTNGGAIRVAVASDNTAFAVNATLQTGSNTVGKVDILGNGAATMDIAQGGGAAATNALQVAGVFNTSLPTLSNGQGGAMQLDSSSRLFVNCAVGCGSGGTVSLVPTSTFNSMLTKHLILAATTNLTAIKASSGNLYGINIYNNTSTPFYVKFYNTASGSVTVGTTTVVYEAAVQAGTEREIHTDNGIGFSNTGFAFAVTAGIADNDTTAVTANAGTVDLLYE